jgi:hypothetical protein
MNPIANLENLTIKLHRYEGSTLCEEIRLSMNPLPQACGFAGAKWKMSSQQVRGPEGIAVSLSLELVEGNAKNVALCVEISFPAWGPDRYLVCPGVVYAGNRFEVRPMAYPPILSDPLDLGADQPPCYCENCSSKTIREEGKSSRRTFAQLSAAPCSRSMPPSSHSTLSGPL